MSRPKKKIIAHFYKTLNGAEPVRDWLLKLSVEDRKTVGKDIQKVSLAGRLECPIADHWGADFLKFGVIYQVSTLRVLFSLSRMR
jgi:hypothetical protein